MAVPVIPATDLVNYIFSFPNAGAAGADPVLGGYPGQEVLLYLTQISSVVPMAGFQPMVSEYGPINTVLYDHPALILAMDLRLPAQGQSAVLTSTLNEADLAGLMIVINSVGTIVLPGLLA